MRLFVAIDLDDDARRAIASLTKPLGRALGQSDCRWTRADQLHLTLAFIGEVDGDLAGKVQASMTPAVDVAPYFLSFSGLGMFPSRGAPRVLWLGSTAGARETIDLQGRIAERLERVGVDLERRPFHPHLTIGRWRESGERDRRTVLNAADTGEVARVFVDHVTLYQSRLSPSGATHTAMVRAAFGAS